MNHLASKQELLGMTMDCLMEQLYPVLTNIEFLVLGVLSMPGLFCVDGTKQVHGTGEDLGILIGGFFFRECISNNHLISI